MTEAFRSPAEVNYLVVALANARDNLSRAQAILAEAQAAFSQAHTPEIAPVAKAHGAVIVEQTPGAPCPGTKIHSESIVVYRTRLPSGEIVRMDVAVRNQHIVDYLIDHGYTSMLKPDIAAFEKATRAMPEDSRMPGAIVTWRTVASTDSDLSPLLEAEKESAPGE